MGLADRLSEYPAADEPKYAPSVEFDGRAAIVQTGTVEQAPDQPPEYAELLRKFGRDPERFRLVAILYEKHWEVPYRPIEGHDANGKPIYGELTTKWLASYKLRVEEIAGAGVADLEAIVRRARAERRPANGSHWFVFQAGDTQLGKKSRGGGNEQIIERYVQSVDAAKDYLRDYRRHGIEGIQICMPGDCIEGNQSQNGRNQGYQTSLVITEQVTVLQRLMLYTVEQFAPLAEQVMLDVVGGNHDDAQRDLNTFPGNNWATQTATSVDIALKLNPQAFRHVTVRVPDKWSGSMTVPVGDTIVTVVHGHQWRTNGAAKWWAEQAYGMQPAGGAHVLQHGHWHQFALESTADRWRVCSPTFDCGSDWYREAHGTESRRGGLVYLLRAGEISRVTVI